MTGSVLNTNPNEKEQEAFSILQLTSQSFKELYDLCDTSQGLFWVTDEKINLLKSSLELMELELSRLQRHADLRTPTPAPAPLS